MSVTSSQVPWTNPDANFGATADRVQQLHEKVFDLAAPYSSDQADTRAVNLNAILGATNAAQATLRLLEWAKQGGDATIIVALRLAKPEYINGVAEDMLRATKLFLLLESQFQLEALFRNILRALGSSEPPRGFYNLVSRMMTEAGLPNPSEKIATMNVAALARNSMHSNGIHNGPTSVRHTIDGVEFAFEPGKPVSCGHWVHVTTALSASLDVVAEILASARVSAFDHIPDLYATVRER